MAGGDGEQDGHMTPVTTMVALGGGCRYYCHLCCHQPHTYNDNDNGPDADNYGDDCSYCYAVNDGDDDYLNSVVGTS